jgi:hypothetical protein
MGWIGEEEELIEREYEDPDAVPAPAEPAQAPARVPEAVPA